MHVAPHYGLHWSDTGTHGSAIHMNRTRAAQAHAASEFGARHAENIAQHPKNRCVAIDLCLHRMVASVDFHGMNFLIISSIWSDQVIFG
jgi:hypothetical protein